MSTHSQNGQKPARIFAENIAFCAGDREILRGVTLEVRPGEFAALIGPNGCGKTTLLKTIYRFYRPSRGAVYIDGENTLGLSARSAARKMAALAQENRAGFDFPVIEVVLMSRYARKKLLEDYDRGDHAVCEHALSLVGMSALRERSFQSLSGGEKQRVLLAAAFAQEAPVILLDEPANHLDIGYQFLIMDMLKNRQLQDNTAIFASMHDINIAARYADRIIAMKDGVISACGTPEETLTPALLRGLFQVHAKIEPDAASGRPHITFLGAAV
jgi:iron complex transport system ATP-binding protein